MIKLKRADYINFGILFVILISICLFITHGEFVYGSKIDWYVQHYTFAEYFRNLFYETHDLFPDFAMNIGGGQNIYYFAYYGFLSPIILLSYFLPSVPMYDYVIFSSIMVILLSSILFYIFLRKHDFSFRLSLVLSIVFLLASPLIFHSHRHVMFMNYMLFLVIGLFGVDWYFEKGKRSLLIFSVFLMIMTSYFYSVGGIISLTLYAVYVYLGMNEFKVKKFLKDGFKYFLNILLSVLMASLLLLPVLYAIKSGRSVSSDVSLFDVLIPGFNVSNVLYSSYSVGLSGICVLSLLCLLLSKKKNVLFLSISLLCLIIFPIFIYLLNGGLYLDAKVLIPFLPLYVLCIGLFLKMVLKMDISFKWILVLGILAILLSIFNKSFVYFACDIILLLFFIFLFYKFKKKFFIVYVCVISFAICLGVNFGDKLVSLEDFSKEVNPNLTNAIKKITSSDDGYYRIAINTSDYLVNRVLDNRFYMTSLYSSTYNANYNRFYYDVFNNNREARNFFITSESSNVLFESFMGVKYLVTDKEAPSGYKFLYSSSGFDVYENTSYLPLFYGIYDSISFDKYNKLDFPSSLFALFKGVTKDGTSDYEVNYSKVDYSLDVTSVNGPLTKTVNFPSSFKDKVLLVRITLSKAPNCSSGDTSIEINGISNKLTCKQWKYFNDNYTFDYTLTNVDTSFDIKFSKGTHYIKDIEIYETNLSLVLSDVNTFDVNYMKGDMIKGSINMEKAGYLITSIPYDKGFKVLVNGKSVIYENVNDGFLGVKLAKGINNVEIVYEAPFALIGKILSLIGFILFIFIFVFDLRKKKI